MLLDRPASPAMALIAYAVAWCFLIFLIATVSGCGGTAREADRYTRQAQAAAAQHAHQPSVYLQNDWPAADDDL